MGLFDVLGKIKKEVKSAETAVSKLVDIVSEVQSHRGAEDNNQKIYRSAENVVKSPVFYNQEKPVKLRDRGSLLVDFKKMIEMNFPEYQVKYQVAAKELDPASHPACTPIEFLFCQNGKPILAVVLVRMNTYRGMNVIGTRKICEAQGITYIRFFEECENEKDYVVNRIRSFL